MTRRKINRCKECKGKLRHVTANQWMCDQSSTVCSQSLNVIFVPEPEKKSAEEEE